MLEERGLTIQESIAQDSTVWITSLKHSNSEQLVKSGREKRNERRKQERDNKK